MTHQRGANRGHIIAGGLRAFHQHGLAEEVAQIHPERGCKLGEHVKATNIALVAFDLAEPVLRATDQVSDDSLPVATSAAIEPDPFHRC